MKALSLFSNIGIGETYLNELGVNVVVANELEEARCKVYRHFHPETEMICGDITKPDIFNAVIYAAKEHQVNCIIATPPCQGMSLAGKMDPDDTRNTLIVKAMKAFTILKPDYMLIENVRGMERTFITVNDESIKILDFVKKEIGEDYDFRYDILDAADYGTPQYRVRLFVRIWKKTCKYWNALPVKQNQINLIDAIGHLPSLEAGEKSDIEHHFAQNHNERHIRWMKNTKSGDTAYNNSNFDHQPTKFENGQLRLITGYDTAYKRMGWDTPSPTITMANHSISSQNNVHPGRLKEDGTYSDARVLTLLEVMILMGLPNNWNVPPTNIVSQNKLRHYLGEAVPPLMMRELFSLIKEPVSQPVLQPVSQLVLQKKEAKLTPTKIICMPNIELKTKYYFFPEVNRLEKAKHRGLSSGIYRKYKEDGTIENYALLLNDDEYNSFKSKLNGIEIVKTEATDQSNNLMKKTIEYFPKEKFLKEDDLKNIENQLIESLIQYIIQKLPNANKSKLLQIAQIIIE